MGRYSSQGGAGIHCSFFAECGLLFCVYFLKNCCISGKSGASLDVTVYLKLWNGGGIAKQVREEKLCVNLKSTHMPIGGSVLFANSHQFSSFASMLFYSCSIHALFIL
jgi:hypothetical protein